MSIFLLHKPDDTEKLISLKTASTLEEAYMALRGSDAVRGCVITTAKPEPETLSTWLLTLKEYGADIDQLTGSTKEDILLRVTAIAYDLGLAVATEDYEYKIKALFNSATFDTPNAKALINTVKDSLDSAIKTRYIFAENSIQFGLDSKDSSQVKLIVSGTASTTVNKDADSSPIKNMDAVLRSTTESVLRDYKLADLTTLNVSVMPCIDLSPENKAKKKLRLRF